MIELKNNILYYIAGYIVRQMLKMLTCSSCANNISLNMNAEHNYCRSSEYSKFLDYCNRGGLCAPSHCTCKIILETENQIQLYTNNFKTLNSAKIGITVLLSVKRKFALDESIFPTLNCENGDIFERPHKLTLISSICSKFMDIRLYSYGNFVTQEILLPSRRRHQLTKSILFANE